MALRTRRFTRLAVRLGGTAALLLVIGARGTYAPAHDGARRPQGQQKPKPAKRKDGTAKKR